MKVVYLFLNNLTCYFWIIEETLNKAKYGKIIVISSCIDQMLDGKEQC